MSFIAGALIISAGAGLYASSKASKSISSSTDQSTQVQWDMFDQARKDLAPYREVGVEAVNQIRQVMKGNYSSFYKSPDYQFRKEEGQKALDRTQNAAGTRFSGQALKEASRYNQDLASTEYGNWFERMFGVANMGEAAAAGSAANAVSTGANVAQTTMAGGQAQAAGILGANEAIQGGIGNYVTLQQYNDLVNRLPQPTPTSTWV